ncbi:MAG: hypothetical protein L3J47_00545 [Sulfurovum sp.]|nr:hypothetical protein [Sulfurovum sp.]
MLSKGRKLARRTSFQGMKISIETDKGQKRHWYDPHTGGSGDTLMKYPYGYFLRTTGDDGDHVDLYLGPDETQDTVYIIRQLKAPKFDKYDEEKVMLGFGSAKEAKAAYLHHYNNPKFFESMREVSVADFKEEYISKSFQPRQPPQQQPGQPQQPMLPTFNPHDMSDIKAVSSGVSSIGNMSDKDLDGMARAIWGDGYKYTPVSPDQVRAEVRGFLQDQLEFLKANPAVAMLEASGQAVPNPALPHTGGLDVPTLGENSDSILNERSLDGSITKEEAQWGA